MDIKQNPFSLYDFLGYIIPGAISMYGVLFIFGHITPETTSLEVIKENLSFDKAEIYIPFILFAYISGHFLSFISSITIEKYSIWAHGYPSKYLLGLEKPGYYYSQENKTLRYIVRSLVLLILAPISLSDYIFGKLIGMRELHSKPLDPLLRNVLRKRIEDLIDQHANISDRENHGKAGEVDFFRYAYHYAVENAPNHLPKMQNYVALYGFLRTITLISLMVFWAILWHSILFHVNILNVMCWLTISGLTTYLFFMGFVKFLRRFSLEALMAMAVTFNSPNKSPDV